MQHSHEWACLFGTICPGCGLAAGLVLPCADAEMMTLHLAEISTAVAPGAQGVLVFDSAG